MNSRNPAFWALIGFGVGAVIATTGGVVHPLDSLLGGIIQAVIWFGVSSLILSKKKREGNLENTVITKSNLQTTSGFNEESSEEALYRMFSASKPQSETKELDSKTCPMCAEQIKFTAAKCRYCQHLLQN